MRTKLLFITVVVCVVGFQALTFGLPAFPGAEGFGSETPGGRGGAVIHVTNLEDSGPGSLREAVTTPGPRIVVFDLSGTIRLKSHLRITEPFCTIAGQTAPGDGITLRDAGLYVNAHDIVIRFIRSRVGPSLVEKYSTQDAIQLSGDDTYNVVVDHCTLSWSIDECVGIRVPTHDVTFSWNIVSEAQRQPFTEEQIGKERSHSMALILSGGPTRCSVHHNLIAHCNSRTPRIQGGRHSFTNNIVYDWGFLSGTISREPEVNFVGNYYKRGPASRILKAICEKADQMGKIYVLGNRSYERPSDFLPEWDPIVAAPAAEHRALEPFDVAPVTVTSAEDAFDAILAWAGAILPKRDPVDTRVVRDVKLTLGGKIDRPADVGGYPEMKSAPPAPDADRDGMPDAWEKAHGLDPNDPDDSRGDADGDGYTNIEAYLQDIVDQARPKPPVVKAFALASPTDAYEVMAADTHLPVRQAGDDIPLYARGFLDGVAAMSVQANQPPHDVSSVEPERYRWREQREDAGRLAFVAQTPGPYIVPVMSGPTRKPSQLLAVLMEDPSRCETPASSLVLALDPATTGGDATDALQKLLDEAGEQGAKQGTPVTVVLEPGLCRVDAINIPSGARLHLATGATLQLSPDGSIRFAEATSAALGGFGSVVRAKATDGAAPPILAIDGCDGVTIVDVLFEDHGGAGVAVMNSKNVVIEGVRVLSPTPFATSPSQGARGRAALHINGCQTVSCTRSLLTGPGDGICITASQAPVADLEIEETVIASCGAAVAIGPDVARPVSGVHMRYVDAVAARRGIVVTNAGGSAVEHLHFEDMTIQLYDGQEPTNDNGRPFIVANADAKKGGAIRDVLFDRVYTNVDKPALLRGQADSWLEGIKFWGVRLNPDLLVGAAEEPGTTTPYAGPKQFLFDRQFVRKDEYRFVFVTWPDEESRAQWQGLLDSNARFEDTKADAEEIFVSVGKPADLARD